MINIFLTCLLAAVVLSGGVFASEDLLSQALAAASPENGEKIFRKCKGCHTIEQGGRNKTGPNLWGVVSREVASAQGFGRYSKAMAAYGGVWSPERLDVFLEKPKAEIRGTRMGFAGLGKAGERADLIAYMNLNGPAPLTFTASATAAPEVPAESETPDYGVLVAAPGVEETFAYCDACHSVRLVAQQGLDREAWIETLEWMVEVQGMVEIEEPDLSVLLDYLTTNYNTDRPNFPKP